MYPSARTAILPAHPRSRGENAICCAEAMGPVGSSPLTRGKRPRSVRPGASAGLIPAHAGKTTPACGRSRQRTAHPRSRGENWDTDRRYHKARGSSPLTRGKLATGGPGQHDRGLIPAHAGKTVLTLRTLYPRSAHPRSRGENADASPISRRATGSSPLTRGKRSVADELDHTHGLIPAHAGKTRGPRTASMTAGAHPRSRGENTGKTCTATTSWGSSPLTRGKHRRQEARRL